MLRNIFLRSPARSNEQLVRSEIPLRFRIDRMRVALKQGECAINYLRGEKDRLAIENEELKKRLSIAEDRVAYLQKEVSYLLNTSNETIETKNNETLSDTDNIKFKNNQPKHALEIVR